MLNMLRTKNTFEEETKFIYDRITLTEKYLAELCNGFAQYSRKTARLRDKGDNLGQILSTYAQVEELNKSLAFGLTNLANGLNTIGDYGDTRTGDLEKLIIGQLSKYESICKKVKEETKQILGAFEKELNRKKQLDRIKERNPKNREQILQAEAELVKATGEVSKTIKNFEERIGAFERQKLSDLKEILSEFVLLEIGYHSRTVEQLTTAYRDIQSIDEQADLQDFKDSLHLTKFVVSRNRIPFKISKSLGSIDKLSKTSATGHFPGIPDKNASQSTEFFQYVTKDNKSESDEDSEQHSTTDQDIEEDEDNKEEILRSKNTLPFTSRRYIK